MAVSIRNKGQRRRRAAQLWEANTERRDRRRSEDHERQAALVKKKEAGQTKRTRMTNQTQRDVTGLQGEQGMAQQELSGQQGIELQGLVGRQREGEQTREFDFKQGESALNRQNNMAVQGLAGEQGYRQAALGVAGRVAQAGGEGAAGIATAGPDFMGDAFNRASVPQETREPKIHRGDAPHQVHESGEIVPGGTDFFRMGEGGVMQKLPTLDLQDLTEEELEELMNKAKK